MNYIIAIIILMSQTMAFSQTFEKNHFTEGFINGCKKHKDAKIIIEQMGKIKGEVILEKYCKCRSDYIFNNLTFKQIEQIYYGYEKMNEQQFQKMEYECSKAIESLLR